MTRLWWGLRSKDTNFIVEEGTCVKGDETTMYVAPHLAK